MNRFQNAFEREVRDLFSREPYATLINELEEDIHEIEREITADFDATESVNVARSGDVVTTRILVPLDARVEDVKVSLRDGVLTVTTPLYSRELAPKESAASVPVDVK